jgi:hypothetical protein
MFGYCALCVFLMLHPVHRQINPYFMSANSRFQAFCATSAISPANPIFGSVPRVMVAVMARKSHLELAVGTSPHVALSVEGC